MIIVAGDPGNKGAICVLDTESASAEFVLLGKSPREIYCELQDILSKKRSYSAYLEDVHSLPGMSAKSNFGFGKSVSKIQTILDILEVPYTLVQPKKWQKVLGVTGKGKDIKHNVANIVTKLYPDISVYGPRGGLQDGKSDSLAIAHYGLLEEQNESNINS